MEKEKDMMPDLSKDIFWLPTPIVQGGKDRNGREHVRAPLFFWPGNPWNEILKRDVQFLYSNMWVLISQ